MTKNEKSNKDIDRRDFIKTATVAGAVAFLPRLGPFVDTQKASDQYYEHLADALNLLPNGFPRTQSNIEILILKKIISSQEAWFAGQLSIKGERIDDIAKRLKLPTDKIRTRIKALSRKGFVWGDPRSGFRLAPFIVGIYEEQWETMDHELAHLIEDYFDEGGVEFMRPRPAIHRVVPAQSAVKSEWILPYDELKPLLKTMKSFRIRDCICRMQQDLIGERKCEFPLHVCLNFAPVIRTPSDRDISMEEALALIDETEKVGLVHSVSNVAGSFYYVCNCCGCCCGILRGITEYGIENSVASANYYAVVDPDTCRGCGTCEKRCHMKAVHLEDGVSVVDGKKCIGCGLCVTGCSFDAVRMERKADEEIVKPPVDSADWERRRLKNRGLI